MRKPIEHERIALRPAEAAAVLGVGKSKIYELMRSEGFPAFRVGRVWLVSDSGLKAWIEDQAGGAV